MNLQSEISHALKETERVFPFNNYIGKNTYYKIYAILKTLRRFLSRFEQKRLLDIGCGAMDYTGIMQLLGFQCYGVDDLNDPWHQRNNNIEKIIGYANNIGIQFYHKKNSDDSIPFETNSFDLTCCFDVIEHLHESPRGILNIMGNYLKPGGLIVITMPNSVSLWKRLKVLVGHTVYPPAMMFYHCIGSWRGHVREYTLGETISICKESGFEVLSSSTYATKHLLLPIPIRQLYLLVGSIFPNLLDALLVICKKPYSWKPIKEDNEAYRKALARGVPKGIA